MTSFAVVKRLRPAPEWGWGVFGHWGQPGPSPQPCPRRGEGVRLRRDQFLLANRPVPPYNRRFDPPGRVV